MLNRDFRNLSKIVVFLVIISTSFVPLSKTSVAALERDYWPTEEWQYSSPKKQKMDSSKLEDMREYIDDNNLAIDSINIVRNGYIIYDYICKFL